MINNIIGKKYASGGTDYVEFTRDILLNVGENRMCTTAIILDDSQQEMDERFSILHVGTTEAAQVTVLDDDDGNNKM